MGYISLKSGTDVRGTAVVTVEHPQFQLTDKAVTDICASFAEFLTEKSGKRAEELLVSVGHDSRISAERIKKCVIDTLSGVGIKLIDCSYCSTPAMFMTTVTERCDGAVMITASHHPYDRNGLKFFLPTGGLSGEELEKILIKADTVKIIEAEKKGEVVKMDYLSKYAASLREKIKNDVNAPDFHKPLQGFKIAVDAGNGVGGFYAEKVLAPLGADVSASQFLEIDGMFPNHIPNPENKTAMEFIRKATVENGCDLGIIFDTDVDRASCVDENGEEINRNAIVALAAVLALENGEGGSIVTDSVTSDGLRAFIENELHGKQIRFKRGYKNVIDEAVRREKTGENVPLAIETSGHAAFKENYYLDDGAYLITKIIIKAARLRKEGRKIGDCIAALHRSLEEKELRFNITAADFKTLGQRIIDDIIKTVNALDDEVASLAVDNYEGVRVNFKDPGLNGWFLLRLSVHDPVMPFNAESDTEGGCKEICKAFYEAVRDVAGVDFSPLEKYINS